MVSPKTVNSAYNNTSVKRYVTKLLLTKWHDNTLSTYGTACNTQWYKYNNK